MTDALLPASCPSDALAVVVALEHALYLALVRRGETYHLRTCRNSHVNSQSFACSAPCLSAQVSLAWARTWRERQAVPTQAGLWEEVAS